MNNPTQNNLLVAQEYGTQLLDSLETLLRVDEGKDKPELRPQLMSILQDAEKLHKRICAMREEYNAKKGN